MGHYLSTLTNRRWKKAPMRGPFYLYLSYDWQVPITWQLLTCLAITTFAITLNDVSSLEIMFLEIISYEDVLVTLFNPFPHYI